MQTQQPKELEEVVGRQRLADKVTGILHRIERDLDSVDSKIGEAMHVLDVDNDGLVRASFCIWLPTLLCPAVVCWPASLLVCLQACINLCLADLAYVP